MISTVNSIPLAPFYPTSVDTTASTKNASGSTLPLPSTSTVNQPLPTIPSFNTLNTPSTANAVSTPVNAPGKANTKSPLAPPTPEPKPQNNNLSGKLLLFGGLLAAGVVAYLIFKNNRPKSDCPYEDDQRLLDIASSWRR